MRTLIIIQKNNIGNVLNGLINASKFITNYCDVLVVGNELNVIASDISKYSNVDKIMLIDNNKLENILVENISKQISNIVKVYTHVLINADSFGKNLLPRVAGCLKFGQISEVVKIISPNIFQKFIYAGNVLVDIESYEDIKLLTVRSNCFSENLLQMEETSKLDKLVYMEYDETQICDKITYISNNIINKSQDLSSARVIVSGGKSLITKDNFENLIIKLANKYNAGIGATRSAVEAGFISNDYQIGQTGKVVNPDVYIAFGISGAVQHIAGMKGAKKVLAINNDPQAPIFEYADFGYVGDLFDVIAELLK
jgi:electron transfer flavoprotein alpha subunit